MKKIANFNRMLFAVLLSCIFVLFSTSVNVLAADGSSYEYEGYVFDVYGVARETPSAYMLADVIDSADMTSYDFSSLDDVSTSEDGRIFISDQNGGWVYIFDQNGEFIRPLKNIYEREGKIAIREDGSQVSLVAPSGTWYHEKNKELYIADSGSKNIVVLDGETYYLKRIIGQPENMAGVTEYVPSKVCVDLSDRIYIIVKSSYEGIVELNEDGTFSRYFGVNEPTVNLVSYFWKTIATDTQKEKLGKIYAPGFTNLALDSEGFVYAVTSDNAANTKIFRLNSKGENVIREEDLPLIGDLSSESRFIDIAVTDYGVSAVLDSAKGRIFIYDYDGVGLNVFGGLGYSKGEFRKPTSLAFLGNDLIVTDTELKCVYILKPTNFGNAVLSATEEYYKGNWSEATEYYKECVKLNANYEEGYLGIGKNYLMQDNYEEAMYYFKLANYKQYYSKAYEGYRGEWIKDHFYIVAIFFILVIGGLIYSEVRYHKQMALKKGESDE